MEIISQRKRTISHSSRQGNWGQMDPNVLLFVFHKLLLSDLLQAVPHVCSSWRMAASQTGFFVSGSHLSLEYLDTLSARERAIYTNLLTLALKLDATYLDRIKFSENVMLPKEVVLLIAQRSTCLENLRLPQTSLDWFSPCLLSKTLPYWRNLKSFEAAVTSTDTAEACLRLVGRHCKRLTHLGITGIIDRHVAEAIATCFPGIQSLDFTSCIFSDLALKIILEGVTNLKTMDLTHSVCGDEKDLKKNGCEGYNGKWSQRPEGGGS